MTRVAAGPRVTVVIPSCRRPEPASRAVRSVLAQTFGDLEVVVVPACPGDGLEENLAAIEDERLRVLAPKPAGASAARNRGVREARGDWVAFLDDDDEWMPRKLELQMQTAAASLQAAPVISCRMLARWSGGELVWPRRLPDAGEPIGDYLFRRRSLFGGGGFVQTSTLLAPRSLLLHEPLDEELQRVEDLDWVLRAEKSGSRVEFPETEEPLTMWDIEDDRPRQSGAGDWRCCLDWIRAKPDLVSPEAYASYLLTWVSADAAKERAGISAWFELWREARQRGRPSLLDAVVHAGHYLAPPGTLRRLATKFTGRRRL